jgi:hypothetical protein
MSGLFAFGTSIRRIRAGFVRQFVVLGSSTESLGVWPNKTRQTDILSYADPHSDQTKAAMHRSD